MISSPPNLSKEKRARLYWQCRRGMLELDAMLQDFFKKNIDVLNQEEIIAFTQMLECPDNLLLEYLMGRTIPVDRTIADIVKKIRHTTVR